jgi:hypothetical protein
VSRLYALCQRITTHLESEHAGNPLGLIRAKGELATQVGFLVSLVTPYDAEDPTKLAALEKAARALGVEPRIGGDN